MVMVGKVEIGVKVETQDLASLTASWCLYVFTYNLDYLSCFICFCI